VLVSHDMRLISQVANEIWICDNKTITKYQGDIQSFKMDMREQMGIDGTGDSKKLLRGDFSVKEKGGEEKKETPAPAPKAKLEIIAPPKKAEPSPPPPSSKAVTDDDEATATTAATNTSLQSSATVDNGAPVKGRYIPPHLRKKMQQQESE